VKESDLLKEYSVISHPIQSSYLLYVLKKRSSAGALRARAICFGSALRNAEWGVNLRCACPYGAKNEKSIKDCSVLSWSVGTHAIRGPSSCVVFTAESEST